MNSPSQDSNCSRFIIRTENVILSPDQKSLNGIMHKCGINIFVLGYFQNDHVNYMEIFLYAILCAKTKNGDGIYPIAPLN